MRNLKIWFWFFLIAFILLIFGNFVRPKMTLEEISESLKEIKEKVDKTNYDFKYICNECSQPIAIFSEDIYCEDCVGKLKTEIKRLRKRK